MVQCRHIYRLYPMKIASLTTCIGVQVVDGSNPSTPTTDLASKSLTISTPQPQLPALVYTLFTPVHAQQETARIFQQLDLLKERQGLSDRDIARTLGISN